MRYVTGSLAISIVATLVLIGLSRPEGESWGRGWNLIVLFLATSAWIWLHVLILLAWFIIRAWKQRGSPATESPAGYRWHLAIALIGLILPVITGLMIRWKAA